MNAEQPIFRNVLLVAFFALGVLVLSRWIVLPGVFKLSNSFQYTADVLSLDNFYNEDKQVFSGEKRSVTTFLYNVDQTDGRTANVHNVFDVRTLAGDQIFAVRRQYSIDRVSWEHVQSGSGVREGYLFAPRKLNKQDAFTYWHVNYDVPVQMVFKGEESISGVTVYKFGSDFGVDQTDHLGHLPGVPDERGVNLDVSLTLWIEPVSGWLVKYEDRAVAYYYDQESGKRLFPWNAFSNRYTKASINSQAAHAQRLKLQMHAVEYGIPLLALVAGLGFVARRGDRRTKKVLWAVVGSVLVIVGGLCVWAVIPRAPEDQVRIGISRWVPRGNEEYDRNIQGFKEALSRAGYKEGVDVVYIDESADSDEKLQEGVARRFSQENVDLIYSLTTPGTLLLKERFGNQPIVFSVVTYPVEAGLIASLERSGNNLVGTRNWVSVEEQLAMFREVAPNVTKIGFVHRTGEPNSTIQLGEMKRAAEPYGITVVEVSGATAAELQDALDMHKNAVDALYSACDTLVQGEAEERIIAIAHEERIPSFSCNISGPRKGDLIGTVADMHDIGQFAGEKAALILEGATPASLETTTATRPRVYVNQKTATLLGITIPQSVLSKATEVIR